MDTIISYQDMGLFVRVRGENRRFNFMWGNEYLFMDSKTFMGSTGAERYDAVIDMLGKIWETNGNNIITR